MKKILGLLSLLTIATPVASLSLNTKDAAINEKDTAYATAKFTDLGNVGKLVKMSDTTGILGGSAFFDSTKVNEESHGIVNLGITGTFVRMSSTTGIFRENNTNEAYFFDSTKINEANKGLIDLEITMNRRIIELESPMYRWSDTILIFEDQNQNYCYFDSTKIDEPSKGLINLGLGHSFARLTDTTGVFIDYFRQTYYIDNTKINDPDRGFIDLEFAANSIKRLSDTRGFLIGNSAYLFDSTKIDDPSKGIIDLNQKESYSFVRISDTTGIFVKYNGQQPFLPVYFFDSTKINDPNKGFVRLEKDIFVLAPFYTRLTDTTGILLNSFEKNGYPASQAYFFDSTKVNDESKGLMDLEKEGFFFNLSDTTGIFTEIIDLTFYVKSYFFDSTKVNESNKGFIELENILDEFVSLTNTTGIGIAEDKNTTYYFEYN